MVTRWLTTGFYPQVLLQVFLRRLLSATGLVGVFGLPQLFLAGKHQKSLDRVKFFKRYWNPICGYSRRERHKIMGPYRLCKDIAVDNLCATR